MPKRNSESSPPRKTVAHLQEVLLKAALLNQPLPGGGRPVRLSDLSFILRHQFIYVSDVNLAGEISDEGLPKPLRTVSKEEVQKLARDEGDLAYLQFRPAEELEDGVIRLTLEGRLATQDPGQHPMGLSSIQVKFRKVGDLWESTDEPTALAG
jgi:hypothetical protein